MFDNFDAASNADPARLRRQLELLPAIAEAGLSRAAKDISQAGLVGTALMLAEASSVSLVIDPLSVPRPPGAPLLRWLGCFPSFGFLLTARPSAVEAIVARFAAEAIDCAAIGRCEAGSTVRLVEDGAETLFWDHKEQPLLGCAPASASASASGGAR